MTKPAILATLCALTLFVACGGDDDAGDSTNGSGGSAGSGGTVATGGEGTAPPELPDEPPPDFDSIDEIPEDEAGAELGELCPVFFACDCPSAEGVTVGQCETYFAGLADRAVAEGIDVTYDGGCVARVKAAFEYLGCVTESQAFADWQVLLGAAELNSCKMYYGTKGEGEACTALSDSNGDDCQAELDCVDGKCELRPGQVVEGDACLVQEDCEAGLVCLPTTIGATDKVCMVLPPAGEACLFGVVCEPGATCVDGECETLPQAGAPCATAADALERVCSPDARCVDDTCETLPLGGEDCADACAPGFACTSGTCVAEAAAVCAGGPFPLFP